MAALVRGPGDSRAAEQGDARTEGTARQYTDEAIAALSEVVKGKTAPAIARVRAAEALLDRGHGWPTRHIEAKINPTYELSDNELAAGIPALRGGMSLIKETLHLT